ncbi:hypothetical protein ACFLW5_00010 [Chloroflexota bacterium]
MTVKIVTDSIANLPLEVVQEPGVIIVPANIRFGTNTYSEAELCQ